MSYSEIQNKVVTVRKRHRCAWCAERINPGERAQYRAYKFDGDLGSDWMHPECADAMARYPDQGELGDGWCPGDFARGSISDQPELVAINKHEHDMTNPETHTCECGYTWRHGQDGSHSCAPHYKKTIAELRAALAARSPASLGSAGADGLLPCPFCSAAPLIQEHEPHTHSGVLGLPDHPGSFTVECPTEGCCGMIASTKEEVIAVWNRRASQPPADAAPVDDQAFDREAERITREAGLGGGSINPNATSVLDLFLDDAAPVDEKPVDLSSLTRFAVQFDWPRRCTEKVFAKRGPYVEFSDVESLFVTLPAPAQSGALSEKATSLAQACKNLRALYFNTNCNPEGFRLQVDATAEQADALLSALAARHQQESVPPTANTERAWYKEWLAGLTDQITVDQVEFGRRAWAERARRAGKGGAQ